MSSPQQPWSPGQPAPGYGPPPAYGPPPGHGGPQGQQVSGYGAPLNQPPQPRPDSQGGATGELVLNLKRPFGSMGMISPVVKIDGYPAPSSWGRNSFVVPAGIHRLEVAQSYLRTYGAVQASFDVDPGRTVELHYAGPMIANTRIPGALGVEPQERPGKAVFIGLMVFLAVLLLVVLLAVVIGSS